MARDFIIPVDAGIYSSSLNTSAVLTQVINPPLVKDQGDRYYFYITTKKINE